MLNKQTNRLDYYSNQPVQIFDAKPAREQIAAKNTELASIRDTMRRLKAADVRLNEIVKLRISDESVFFKDCFIFTTQQGILATS